MKRKKVNPAKWNKSLALLLSCLMIFASLVFPSSIRKAEAASSLMVYDQNFEDGLIGSAPSDEEWSVSSGASTGTLTIEQAVYSGSSTQALTINKTSTGASLLADHMLSSALNTGSVTVSVDVYSDKANQTSYFLITDANNNVAVQVGLYDGGRGIAYDPGNGTPVAFSDGSFEADTWYHLDFILFPETKKLDIYLDGELKVNKLDFRSAAVDRIEKLRVGMFNFSTGITYFDNMKVVSNPVQSAPTPPEEITAEAANGQITLNWGASMNASQYKIFQATNPGGYEEELTIVDSSVTSYKITGLTNGTTYYYVISALNSSGESPVSEEVSATPQLISGEVYNQDFESMNANEWNVSSGSGTGALSIADVAYEDGSTKALMINKTSEGSSSLIYDYNLETALNSGRVTVSADIRPTDTNNTTYFIVQDSGSNIAIQAGLYALNGYISYDFNGTIVRIAEIGSQFEADKWYNLKFVLYPETKKIDVYLDGDLKKRQIDYRHIAATDIKKIRIGMSRPDKGISYFDNFKIESHTDELSYEITTPLDISTKEGTMPLLPDTLDLLYENGNTEKQIIHWNPIESSSYAAPGHFSVNGTTADTGEEVTAQITVTNSNIQASYYVSPEGNDSNSGTLQAPFKTIQKARDQVRTINADMTGDIVVYLMAGTYEESSAIEFISEDSGSNGYYVRYEAYSDEKPIISGGKKVTGWKIVPGTNYYEAETPVEEGYAEYARQLYVNGVRAQRASSEWIQGDSYYDDPATPQTTDGINFTPSLLQDYSNPSDVRLLHVHIFKVDEFPVSDIVSNDNYTAVQLTQPFMQIRVDRGYIYPSDKFMIVNAKEELDKPGEWYHDRAAEKIYYYPYSNENMENAEVIALATESDHLLNIEGDSLTEQVENIRFKGIVFEHSNWMYTENNFIGGSQAEALYPESGIDPEFTYGQEVPGSIHLNHTNGIQFLGNTVRHTANVGIHLYNDVSNTLIQGNLFYDTTGAAIEVGRFKGAYLDNDIPNEGRVKDNIINNNVIRNTGSDFMQATGISIMPALRTTITHNDIDYSAYMAIHSRMGVRGDFRTDDVDVDEDIGQGFIAYNKTGESNWAGIYGVADNAPIYSFGPAKGTIIYQNYVSKPTSQNLGVYNDDNSYRMTWKENVIIGFNYMSPRSVDPATIIFEGNYGTSGPPSNANSSVRDFHSLPSNDVSSWPAAAQEIYQQAGVEAEYEHLLNEVPGIPDYNYLNTAAPAQYEAPVLQTAVAGDGQVTLSWSPSAEAESYKIFASESSLSHYTPIDIVSGSADNYVVENIANGTSYFFVVQAITAGGDSVFSNELSAAPVEKPSSTDNDDGDASEGNEPIENGNSSTEGSLNPGTVMIIANPDAEGKAIAMVDADEFDTAIGSAENNIVTISVQPGAGTDAVEVGIPVTKIFDAKDKGIERIKMDVGLAVVSITTDLLKQLDRINSTYLRLLVSKVDLSTIPATLHSQIDISAIYEFTLIADETKISSFEGNNDVQVEVSYALKPDEEPGKVVIYYIDDNGELEVVKNGQYDPVIGKVIFSPKHFSKYAAAYVNIEFADMNQTAWANSAVEALAARGIINGVGSGNFDPNAEVTRAQFITMMMKAFDLMNEADASSFNDVIADSWYYSAVASAQELGITSGRPDGSFGVNDSISRQDAAVMIYKLSLLLAADLEKSNRNDFADMKDVSDYARQAVTSMHRSGIINGVGGNMFSPEKSMTRAEAAVIIYRLFDIM